MPPSINHYKTMGRLKTSKKGNLYREQVNSTETMAYYCQVINICRRKGVNSLTDARIKLEIDIHPPCNRRMDISNRVKVLEDALVKGGCFDDDSQIDWLVVKRCCIVEYGQIIVRIMPL